ncbi:hypothetical protein jhhlp_004582 [Lomentospora prolificans]|uniref:SET domain-containing protein n=1 Tax=Lomentospora prolificans TaxID=41688 RepID=A0A2N3NBZ7_9PEZI|nr:hypothetical protein jhhlp_004582 [Lomentospora prolificans]
MKLLLPLLIASSAAVLADTPNSQRTIDLGTYCYPPIFNSDAAHLHSCPSEDLDPRYTTGPTTPPRARKHKKQPRATWDKIGPCLRGNATDPDSTEFCVYYSSAVGGPNRGIIVLTEAERADYILKYPAFHDPEVAESMAGGTGLNKFTPKAKVVPIPGKEYGVVATETIFKGESIIAETASMLVDYSPVYKLPQKDVMRLQAFGLEYLPDAHRERVLNMSTHGSRLDVVHKLEKVLVTNAFEVKVDDDNDNGLYALFADSYHWDYKTFTQYATAIRTIYPGEELTVSYINGLRPHHKRQSGLRRSWGFSCTCPVCSVSTAQISASDARLKQITLARRALADRTPSSPATPQLAEMLISLLEQERMHILMGEAYAYAALEWNGVGEAWTATRYARRAIEEEVMQVREEKGEDIEDMMDLVEDPWEHWSWLWRTRKRMNWKPLRDAKKKEIEEAVEEAAVEVEAETGSGGEEGTQKEAEETS